MSEQAITGVKLVSGENARERGLAARLVAGATALLLWAGLFGLVFGVSGATVGTGTAIASAAVAVVLVAAACALFGRGRSEVAFYLAGIGAIAVVCAVAGNAFVAGGAAVVNAFLLKVGSVTQEYALPYVQDGGMGLSLFCCVSSAVLALFAALMANRAQLPAALVLAAGALAGAVAGWIEPGWWMAPFALGVIGCALVGTLTRDRSRAGAPWAAVAAFAAVACLAGAVGSAAVAQGAQVDTREADGVLASVVDRVMGGGKRYAMPEGDLSAIDASERSDQVALRVEVNEPTFDYLRGFVGERLGDDGWEALAPERVLESRGLFYWLGERDFDSLGQLRAAAGVSGFEDGGEDVVNVTYEAARGPYAYLPYAYGGGGDARATTDLAQSRRGDGESAAWSFGPALARKAYLVQDELESLQEAADEDGSPLREYLDTEGAYREFVRDAYLEVPEQVTELLEGRFDNVGSLDVEQAKLAVRELLEEYAGEEGESAGRGRVAGSGGSAVGQDRRSAAVAFVQDFLDGRRSGGSVEYATVSTLVMRYLGVPARYVEGYQLNTQRLDARAGADTDDAGVAAGSFPRAYELTEEDAHAWCEYYLDGVGWVPFDVAPGWGGEGYFEPTPGSKTLEDSDSWSAGEAGKSSEWSLEPEEADQRLDDDGDPTFADLAGWNILWPWALAGFLFAIVAVLVVRDIVLHARLRRFIADGAAGRLDRTGRRAREGEGADASGSVAALFAYAVVLLESCAGVELGKRPYSQDVDAVASSGVCDADVFARAVRANDRALFSARGATTEDVADIIECIERVQAGLRATAGIPRRLEQRHVRCLW